MQRAALSALQGLLIGSPKALWLTFADLLQDGSGSAGGSDQVSAQVTSLQGFLDASGWSTDPDADGYFGASTQAAVVALQTQLGVHADGVVGPETRAAVVRALGGALSPASLVSVPESLPFLTAVPLVASGNAAPTAAGMNAKTVAVALFGLGVVLFGVALFGGRHG